MGFSLILCFAIPTGAPSDLTFSVHMSQGVPPKNGFLVVSLSGTLKKLVPNAFQRGDLAQPRLGPGGSVRGLWWPPRRYLRHSPTSSRARQAAFFPKHVEAAQVPRGVVLFFLCFV